MTNQLLALTNQQILLTLMIVLIVFVVMLMALAIVFIIALRKRRPVVKVVMAPTMPQETAEPVQETVSDAASDTASEDSAEPAEPVVEEPAVAEVLAPVEQLEQEGEDDDEDEDSPAYVIEGQERVRYNRSFSAKICQLSKEAKEWYSAIKNEILSYEKVKDRISWKRETFRIGRMSVARLVVRGKTLCLLFAVEPISYNGTKYVVEDVSNIANTADTPTLYRIKSARRMKYAKEMIAGMMKELKSYKDPRYEAKDFFVPYEGDMALIERGLIKRIVTNSTRVFKIEELDEDSFEQEVAATDADDSEE